jgi:DNA-directed RNA polymerase subunit RPC12/RpoP
MASTKCSQCGSADVSPLLGDEFNCRRCGAKFDSKTGEVSFEGQGRGPNNPGERGVLEIRDADGVTVAYAEPEKDRIRTSTTVEATSGEAIPATESDGVAAKNAKRAIVAGEAMEARNADDLERAEGGKDLGTVTVTAGDVADDKDLAGAAGEGEHKDHHKPAAKGAKS